MPVSREKRRLKFESLEIRRLLVSDWHNPYVGLDTNFDGVVSAIDVLLPVNRINEQGSGALPDLQGQTPTAYYDTNDDGILSPIDVLGVVNALNGLADSPVVVASLTRDTAPDGGSDHDLITRDASIEGSVRATLGVASVSISIDDGPEAFASVDPTTKFIFQPSELTDGPHLVRLTSRDSLNHVSAPITLQFTLDTTPPTVPTFDLLAASDTAPLGDGRTTEGVVSLVGVTTPQSTVTLAGTAMRTTANASGQFQFDGVTLDLGTNEFVITAQDVAGNSIQNSKSITRAAPVGPQPPVLDPIDEIEVVVGAAVSVPLHATDPNGDFIHYTLDTLGMTPTTLPNGKLDSSGAMIFNPAPGQEGTYEFRAVASDGTFDTKQPVVLRVLPDPVQTTRLSGIVLDEQEQPVTGIRVNVGTTNATTDANGVFQLDFGSELPSSNTLEIRGDEYVPPASSAHPERRLAYTALSITSQLGHAVYRGVNNHLRRPAYTESYAPAAGTLIDPAHDTLVTSPEFPGASLLVPAGSVRTANGELYSGRLSLVRIPFSHLASELPPTFLPDNALTIQPSGLVFQTLPRLKVPNLGQHSLGTFMEGFISVPAAGTFESFGFGNVRSDTNNAGQGGEGEVSPLTDLNTGGPSFSGFDIVVEIKESPGTSPAKKDEKSKKPEECEVGIPPLLRGPSQCGLLDPQIGPGSLRAEETVSSYSSIGASRDIRLVYDSLSAHPNAIIPFTVSDVSGDEQDRLVARMSISTGGFDYDVPGDSGAGSPLTEGLNYWSLAKDTTEHRVSLLADLSSVPTGELSYQVSGGVARVGGEATSGVLSQTSGSIIHVNRAASSFGAGWGMAGLQEIFPQANGSQLLVDGDGTALVFTKSTLAPEAFVSPPGDFSTLRRNQDGTLSRRLTNGTIYHFNSANKLASVIDSNGNSTQYDYDETGALASIRDGVGLETKLGYRGGMLSTVTSPAGVVTQFGHDDRGNLTDVEHPDGGKCQRTYDEHHALSTSTCAIGATANFQYDFAGRIDTATLPDGNVQRYDPSEVAICKINSETISPDNPPETFPPGPTIGTYIDGNENVFQYEVDDRGLIISSSDSFGSLGQSHYNYNELNTRNADSLGNVEVYTFDQRGNQLSHQDSLSSVAVVSGSITQPGEQFIYRFTAHAHQRFYFASLSKNSDTEVRLYTPTGDLVDQFRSATLNDDVGPFEVDVTGDYELRLSSTEVGTFRFELLDVATVPTITVGTAIQGGLEPSFGPTAFRFRGQAGQILAIDDLEPRTNSNVDWRIISPSGTSLSQVSALPVTGDYLLVLSSSAPADFSFRISSPPARERQLQLDVPVNETLTQVGEMVTFRFEGQAGQRILLDIAPTSAEIATLVLRSPSGESLPTYLPTILPENGSYSLVMTAAKTGVMRFTLHAATSLPVLETDDTLSGHLTQNRQSAWYRFSGMPGQMVTISKVSTSGISTQRENVYLNLYDPNNQTIDQGSLGQNLSVQLAANGDFFVQFEAVDADMQVGSALRSEFSFTYQLRLEETTPVDVSGLGTFSGTIATVNQRDTYSFTAPAGLELYFDSLSSNDCCNVSIRDRDNTTVFFSNASLDGGPFVIPKSGDYSIRVESNSDAVGGGDYEFRLIDLSTVPVIEDGTTLSGTTFGSESAIFRYTGSVGDVRYMDQLTADANHRPAWLNNLGESILPDPFQTVFSGFLTFPGKGNFYLVLRPLSEADADYSFRLLNPSSATSIETGSTIERHIAEPNGAGLFRIDGHAGQRLFIKGPTTFEGKWSLHDSFGIELDSATLGAPLLATLPSDGDYWLAVDSSNASELDYSFTVSEPTISSSSLALGSLTNGTISEPGEVDQFTFAAASGQQIYFDGLDAFSTGQYAEARLIAPSGQVLFSQPTFGNISITLPAEDGTYRLEVTADKSVSYRFRVLDVASAPLVNFGTTVTDSLGDATETKLYRFHGNVDTPYFLVPSLPTTGRVNLYGPNGQAIPSTLGEFRGKLPVDGDYLITIDSSQSAFAFSFQLLSPQTTTTTLELGRVVTGNIPSPGDVAVFTMTGETGQKLLFTDISSSAQFTTSWAGPDGSPVITRGSNLSSTEQFVQAGPHSLSFESPSNNTGSVQFRVDDLSSASSLTLGGERSGHVANAADVAIYRFTGVAGQTLRLQFGTTPIDATADWVVIDPFLEFAYSGDTRTNESFDAYLPYSGDYFVVLRGTTAALDYQLRLTDVSETAVPATGLDVRHQGTVAANDLQTVEFTASAGQRIYYDSLLDPNAIDSNVITLLDPAGQQVTNLDELEGLVSLSSSGTYTVQFQNDSDTDSPFDFRLINADQAQLITLNQATQVDMTPGTITKLYRVEGRIGQRLMFVRNSGDEDAFSAELLSLDGRRFQFDTSNNPGEPISIDYDGTFFLVLKGLSASNAALSVTLFDVSSAPTTALGATVEGRLSDTSGVNVSVYQGHAGERLYFDSLSTSPTSTGDLRVYAPRNNAIVSFHNPDDDIGFDLPYDGRYVFVLSTAVGSTLDYRFRVLQPAQTTSALTVARGDMGRLSFDVESQFSQPVGSRDELGHTTIYEVDPITGNRLSTLEIVGSPGGNDDPLTRYTYESHGLVATMTDPLGNITAYEYDAHGQLSKITLAMGSSIQADRRYEHDAAGNMTAIIDESGHRTDYHYDVMNRLVQVDYSDPDGAGPLAAPILRNSYNTVGNLLSTTDPNGNVTTYQYDNLNRLIQKSDPAPGGTTRYEYDENSNITRIIDPLNRSTVFTYDARDRATRREEPTGAVTLFVYDANDNLIQVTNARGNTETMGYDARLRPIVKTDALGQSTRMQYDAANHTLESTDENGHTTKWQYDDLSRLLSMTDANGNVTSYAYDLAGNQVSTTDALHHTTQYGYDARNRQVSKSDALLGTSRFELDAVGNLAASTDELNHSTQYGYDALNRRIRMTDANGGVTTWAYDANGNNTLRVDPLGHETHSDYDSLNRQIRLTDPLDHVTSWEYDKAGNVVATTDAAGRSIQYLYDGNDQVIQTTDANGGVWNFGYDLEGNRTSIQDPLEHSTTYQYDKLNRLITVTDALGHDSSYAYDPAGNVVSTTDRLNRVTLNSYDAVNRRVKVTDALGGIMTVSYDAVGNVTETSDQLGRSTSQTYDALDRVVSITDALDGTRQFTYDASGNLVRTKDELGRETAYQFDALHRRIGITDALNGQYDFEYDLAGRLIRSSDPLEHATTYQYDAANRRTVITDALGGTTEYAYDAVGNTLSVTDPLGRSSTFEYDKLNRMVSATDPLGNKSSLTYDGLGNKTKATDPLGNVTRTAYDALSRPVKMTDALGNETSTTYDAVGNVIESIDAVGQKTRRQYDGLNRLLAVSDPLNHSTQFTYDAIGNLIRSSDPLGHVQATQYDDLNRPIENTDANGETTRFEYDAAGNQTKVTDPLGNTTTSQFDSLDRNVSETNALNKSRVYAFDAVGNLVSATDRDGRVRKFTYDALNRQVREDWLDGNNQSLYVLDRTYNAADQLTDIHDPFSAYQMTFDAGGRLTDLSNEGTPGAPVIHFQFGFDAAGNRLTRADNVNNQPAETLTYAYDPLNRVASMTQNGPSVQEKRVDITYDSVGRIQAMTRYGRVDASALVASTSFTYDASSRLTELTHKKGNDTLASYEFERDAANRLTQVSDADGITTFAYDDRNQLTSVSGVNLTNATYSYDGNGNRVGNGETTGADNRITSDGTFGYEYDNEGNLTARTNLVSGEMTAFSWDYRNRLVSITSKNNLGIINSQANYTYDVFDNRIAKTVDDDGDGPQPPHSTRFVYEGADLTLELDEQGAITRRYFHGPLVDQVFAEEDVGGETHWMLTDQLGSVRDITDADGEIADHLRYDAFGNLLSESNPQTPHHFTYTGREFDVESGLYYYRARYFDARAGRFISQDPTGFAAGDANLYRYVGNRPTMFRDPLGLEEEPGTYDPAELDRMLNGDSVDYAELDQMLSNNNDGPKPFTQEEFDHIMNERLQNPDSSNPPPPLKPGELDEILDAYAPHPPISGDENSGGSGSGPGTLTGGATKNGPLQGQAEQNESRQDGSQTHDPLKGGVDHNEPLQGHADYFGPLQGHLEDNRYQPKPTPTKTPKEKPKEEDSKCEKTPSAPPLRPSSKPSRAPTKPPEKTCTENARLYSLVSPIMAGAHESIVVVNDKTGEFIYLGGRPLDGRTKAKSFSQKGFEGWRKRLAPIVTEVQMKRPIPYREAYKIIEDLEADVNAQNAPYSMWPGAWDGFGIPNSQNPNATTSNSVAAEAKRRLGAEASWFGPGTTYFLPGTSCKIPRRQK